MEPEKAPDRREGPSIEVESAAQEQAEKLSNKTEKSTEQSPDTKKERLEVAKKEAKEVISKESGKEKQSGGEPGFRAVRRVTERQKKSHYKRTMRQVQKEMPTVSRTFSRFIHNPVIEKTSDTLGTTIARPNAILAGSFTAFIFVLALYLISKHYGYALSGSETIAAFILGWLVGIIYDYARVGIRGKS